MPVDMEVQSNNQEIVETETTPLGAKEDVKNNFDTAEKELSKNLVESVNTKMVFHIR